MNLGETLTVAELAGLNLAPALRSREAYPWNGSVVYVPRNCGRVPLPLLASLPADLVDDAPVEITDLPSNGSVFLADGMTAIACGQAIMAAQLCGLTFRPAADAVGQISMLRYQSHDQVLIGEVLLVVGPDAALSRGLEEKDTSSSDNFVSPIVAALLLQAGLSSLSSTAASAAVDANDLVPDASSGAMDVADATAPPISDQAAAPAPNPIAAPASPILAGSTPAEIGTTSSTLANTGSPEKPLRRRIGSSSPPDFSNLKPAPLLQNTASAITSTSPTQTTAPLSSGSTQSQEFVAGPTLLSASTMQPPTSGPFSGEHISTLDIKGNVSGTRTFEISDKAVLEFEGSVSGQLTNGSFSGITVSFVTGNGELILDHSAQFHGLIASSSPTTPLTPNNLIDLKDLAFTSSMSASVQYNGASNISTVNFTNGSANVTLWFSGNNSNWTFQSDGNGGTIVADPTTNPIVLENQKPGTSQSVWQVDPGQELD